MNLLDLIDLNWDDARTWLKLAGYRIATSEHLANKNTYLIYSPSQKNLPGCFLHIKENIVTSISS